LERRGEADLALEAVGAQHRRHVGRENLEHHLPAERSLLREEDAAHAAAAQLTLDGVLRAEGVLEAAAEIVHQGLRGSPTRVAIRFFTSRTCGIRSASASFQRAVNFP